LRAFPRLPEFPTVAHSVGGGESAPVAGGDQEGEGAFELFPHRPDGAPVAVHGGPGGGAVFDLDGHDVAGAGDVVDEDHEEPGVARHGEADAALPLARDAPVVHGRDPADAPRQRFEGRHGQVEVPARRVAPPVRGARRAEVGRGDDDGAGVAVAPVLRRLGLLDRLALELEAGAAQEAPLEERRAERRSHGPVSQLVRVLVPARARLRPAPVRRAVECDVAVVLPPCVVCPLRAHHRRCAHHRNQHGEQSQALHSQRCPHLILQSQTKTPQKSSKCPNILKTEFKSFNTAQLQQLLRASHLFLKKTYIILSYPINCTVTRL
jgi:hypothetical protein